MHDHPPLPPNTGTPKEAAALVGVHINTVRRWIASGHLRSWRVGPHLLRVDLDELAVFVGGKS